MRYGAMNCPMLGVEEEIQVVGDLGFDYLELTMDPPYADYLALRKKSEQLIQLMDRYNLGLVCHLPTFVFYADLTKGLREASISETIEALSVARQLGCEKAVLHPWVISGLGSRMPDMALEYGRQGLKRILEDAAEKGVKICLENLFPWARSLESPDDFIPWLDNYPDLQLTLDTGHANLVGGLDTLLSFINRFSHRIGHLHVSDNRGQTDDHLPIGAGKIDFATAVKALNRAGYDDTVTFEIFTDDREYLALSREKFQKLLSRT